MASCRADASAPCMIQLGSIVVMPCRRGRAATRNQRINQIRKTILARAGAGALGIAAMTLPAAAVSAQEGTLYKNPQCTCCDDYTASAPERVRGDGEADPRPRQHRPRGLDAVE